MEDLSPNGLLLHCFFSFVKGSLRIPHFMSCSAILRVSNFFISAGDLISRYRGMVRIFDAPNAGEISEPLLGNTLASTTEKRVVNRATFLLAEFH